MEFTKKSIASITLPTGKSEMIYFDDDVSGFGVRLRRGGSATWIFQYRVGSKQRRVSFGSVKSMTVEAARKIARDLHAKVRLGGDPAGDKADARTRATETFGLAMLDFLKHQARRLKPRSLLEVERHMKVNAKPLHDMELTKIDRRTIATQLGRMAEKNGAVAANRARATWSSFFNWCAREGLIDVNPAAFTNKRAEASRERVLSDDELRAISKALPSGDYGDAVRLLTLTGLRRREIGDLRWSEIDFERGLIVLPAARTKNSREHIVPMSAPVRAILEARPKFLDRDLVFGLRGGGFSGWAKCKTRLNEKVKIKAWTIHDLRRTMATKLAEELGQQPHIIEAVLNHVSGHKAGVHGVYNRSQYLVEKKQALALWAEHVMAIIEGRASNVVTLRTA